MTNCERCGRPRKLNAFGLCDDCQIELAGEPNPTDPNELARFRSALAQDAPCPDCHGGGQVGRMTQDGTTMYLVTCDKCGGSGRARRTGRLRGMRPQRSATMDASLMSRLKEIADAGGTLYDTKFSTWGFELERMGLIWCETKTNQYAICTLKPAGWAALEAAPEPRDHSMDCYRERLTAQYAEHAQPAVNRADPAESNLAAYAEFMQGHAQESEKRALAAEARLAETRQALEEQRERADAAEWAARELRAALEGLLESGCVDYVNPRTEDTSCAVCGGVNRHPIHHAPGCAVQVAEDALGDTEDVGELVAWLARYEALATAARTIMFEAVPFSDQGGGFTITEDEWLALRAATTALEETGDE